MTTPRATTGVWVALGSAAVLLLYLIVGPGFHGVRRLDLTGTTDGGRHVRSPEGSGLRARQPTPSILLAEYDRAVGPILG